MKSVTKKLAALVLVGIMMFSLTACGVDMNKVKGDWTVSTIGGKDLATVAAEKGIPEQLLYINYTISDKEIVLNGFNNDLSGNLTTDTYTLKKRSNGVEGYKGDTVMCSLIYDEKADTLTMKIGTDEATAVSYVFVKGSKDLQAAQAALMGGSESA
jgi:uncharacterized lipoprotein YehR (DUF1307 family)